MERFLKGLMIVFFIGVLVYLRNNGKKIGLICSLIMFRFVKFFVIKIGVEWKDY